MQRKEWKCAWLITTSAYHNPSQSPQCLLSFPSWHFYICQIATSIKGISIGPIGKLSILGKSNNKYV